MDSDEALQPTEHKRKSRKIRWVAIATIVSGAVAVPAAFAAFYPIWKDSTATQAQMQHNMDGPIAEIATRERGWDKRGFDPRDMNSLAEQVTYQYAGHFKDKDGDHNPMNQMCSVTLHANPSTTLPYGKELGFVYVQAGTDEHPTSEVLYNPASVDAVYRLQQKNGQYVPPQCWPGDGHENNDVRYPHSDEDYR
jgi:hypothetical protein